MVLLSHRSAEAASGYAGEFLAIGAGARGMAMGGAYVALVDDATAGYWNSAALASLQDRQVHLMHAERFSGLVDQDFLAIVTPSGRLDGVAVSLLRLGVDNIPFTSLPDPSSPPGPDNRPLVTENVSSSDYALYLSGGKHVRERIDLGASVKAIYRTVDSFSAYGLGLDLGVCYEFAPGVRLAANLRDVTTTPIVWNTETVDHIQPSLNLGVAWARQLAGGQTTLLVGSRTGGDAEDHAGTTPVSAGFEYNRGNISLRAGFEEGRGTFGLGLRPRRSLSLDVAYLQHDDLESTYLLSADLGF